MERIKSAIERAKQERESTQLDKPARPPMKATPTNKPAAKPKRTAKELDDDLEISAPAATQQAPVDVAESMVTLNINRFYRNHLAKARMRQNGYRNQSGAQPGALTGTVGLAR